MNGSRPNLSKGSVGPFAPNEKTPAGSGGPHGSIVSRRWAPRWTQGQRVETHDRSFASAGCWLRSRLARVAAAATLGAASVGDCIDAGKQVVDCGSSSAAQKLVSDQSDPNAIACVQIGSKPQTEVKVGDGTFCAETVK